ncbi:MAG TPA: lmo0937 family membrane protein [Vicinamibacterales bacterium]|nr:lmo0937 family membrane protein [Acidobacteriota bacterium]HOC18384.1 lmo0937 family membrane protein [Vicinamibacterales bacterium]
MLFTIAAILLVLWLLGFATGSVGSIIHIVLVIALVLFLVGLVSGRRTVV